MSGGDPIWRARLAELERRALRRTLKRMGPSSGSRIRRGDAALLNFSSNDYLGFAAHPALAEAAREAIGVYGLGSGASRLVCGNSPAHEALEERLAEFKGTSAALVFSSGYATALGVIPALLGVGDVVILDKLAHACLIDAARLSGAQLRVFPHNHMDKLQSLLRSERGRRVDAEILVVTESVFSMDGDRCPLGEIVALKDKYGARLLLDEAHAFGVLGRGGRGLAEAEGLAARVDLQMGTLSKAAGASGGYLCGSRPLIDLLINRARSFIYSTAPPAALAVAARVAIDLMESPEGDRRRLALRKNLAALADGLGLGNPSSPIVPLIVGAETDALELAQRLESEGILVPAIRYPTVPKGGARLRISLSATHQIREILALIAALRAAGWLPE